MKNQLLNALMAVVLLASCSRNQVALDFTTAKDEVPVLGNLVFRFSQLLAADSMLNQWDSTAYISFSPAIPGRFRWEAKDQLVFSPARPLLPATDYKASLNKAALLNGTTYDGLKSGSDLKFFTPDIKLEQYHFTWIKSTETGKPLPRVEMQFNYPVDAAELRKKLTISVDGKAQLADFETVSAQALHTCLLKTAPVADREVKMSLEVGAGLKPQGGSKGSASPQVFEGELASPYVLLVSDVQPEHDGNTGTIFMRTSQGVVPQALQGMVQLQPAATFSVEATENGLLISGGFDVNTSYTVTLKKGLQGVLGGTLKEQYDAPVTFGQLEPGLEFTNSKAVYLSAGGQKNIALRISNIPRIKLIVSKVYESNLLIAGKYGYYPQDNGRYYDDYYEENTGDFLMGDILYEQEIDTRTLPKQGANRLLYFNPDDKLKGYKGIYHIMVRSTEDYWLSSSRFIALSDIGLIAKAGSTKMLVFANSLQSAGSLSGVGVQVYGSNNQLMGSGSTNEAGVAEINLAGNSAYSGFKPAMVIARLGDDYNYLPFYNTAVNTSRYAVGGKKASTTGVDAFVMPERDIYRPGETMRFGVIIRDAQRKNPGSVPLKIKMLLPSGKELTQLRKTTNDQGVTEATISLSQTAQTGTYLMELYNGSDVLISTYNFKVEEFVPDRIKVTARLLQEQLKPGNTTQLLIDALNYYGPPAANRNYELEVQVKEKSFAPAAFPRFDFALSNRSSFFDKVVRLGKTDAGGKAAEAWQVPAMYANMGLLQARFFATVFDENGRPVSRNTTASIQTQPVMLGIGDMGNSYYALNQPARFPLVALNAAEKVAGATARITVIKHSYKTVLSKSGEYFRYQSQKEEKQVQQQDITISGSQTVYAFVPREAGEYELRVALPGADTYVARHFYSYGGWGGSSGDFEVNSDGTIDVVADKATYKNGDRAKLLFKTPFDGRLLLTVENNEVLYHEWITVTNRAAAAEIALTDAYLPNVYVTATLFKPHTTSSMPLTAAHGFANINISDDGRRIPVAIQAATQSRSNRQQTITVKAAPGSMVNLAAVDNGILAVTGFRTPDPYTWYFSKKALGVQAWDLYPLLFPELRRSVSSTGGDGDLSMDMRQNPVQSKRFKLLSYWSGWQKAGSGGEVTFQVNIPEFSGQVRLMAVSVKDDRFGAAEATMQVADPLVLSTAMPRFLTPGDSVQATINIRNTTGSAVTVSPTIKVTGPLQTTTVPGSLRIEANSEGRVVVPVVAGLAVGNAQVSVAVSGLGETFRENFDIAVRPASTLQQRTGSGVISANGKAAVAMPLADFIPATVQYSLVVSGNPVAELGNSLRYLLDYPHGCTEQVISKAFPQLYAADIGRLVPGLAGAGRQGQAAVEAAIQSIKMRQLYNGALTMWNGGGPESWWVTAYAAHFLLEAKKAGYAPENTLLEPMLQYLAFRLRKKELVEYYYNGQQQKRIAPKEVAYSLYVLAVAGRPNASAMNYYKANAKDLSLDSRYVLAAAYALGGDQKSFQAMLPTSFAGETSVPVQGGSLYSPLRDEGLALNVLLDVNGQHPQVPVMARHLVKTLKATPYFNTQEAVFALLALGKMSRLSAAGSAEATITAGGRQVAVTRSGFAEINKATGGNAGNFEILAKGNAPLYYWWQASGISSTGTFTAEDKFIKVRRQVFDRYGKPLSGNVYRQGDLLIVQVVLEKAFSGPLDNIAVTDLLPAGFEIENARIKDLPGMDWVKDATEPLHRDVRDDRIHFYTNLSGNRQVFYYSVRAVTPGTYLQGPVSADAMYDASYHSYWGAGKVRITQ